MRERVPLLIKVKNSSELIDIGEIETMADVGATVAQYFNTEADFGTSFLNEIFFLIKILIIMLLFPYKDRRFSLCK